MTRIRFFALIAVFGTAAGATFAACSTNNPGMMSYPTSGSSTGTSNGAASGSSGSHTGSASGAATGSAGTGASGSAATGMAGSGQAYCPAVNCTDSTRYVDPHRNPNDGGSACVCAGNGYSTTVCGSCTCQMSTPLLCHYDAGQPPQCVDVTIDSDNCGGCGVACKPKAACNNSKCGAEPTQFVAPAPGCITMRIVIENGIMYWADMGHGTIMSKPTAGGATTTIATGIHIAASQSNVGPKLWPVGPFAAGFMVHNATVYWIGSADTVKPADDAGNWAGGV